MSEQSFIKRDRHCAYCLKFLPSGTSKLCGKCHRRAYCSKECQIADWTPGIGSQGHKNWCSLGCGEEDIDWEVKFISEEKGLGIVAKISIPSKTRIMVDAMRHDDHPAIADLAPIDGTLDEKIQLNQFACGGDVGVFLRFARLNHDCEPNSGQFFECDDKVLVLIADHDIEPGEEITIPYLNTTFSDAVSPSIGRILLFRKWGIRCEADCFCRNKDFERIFQQCVALDEDIKRMKSNLDADGAMIAVKKLLEILDVIHVSWLQKMTVLFEAFRIGIMKRATLEEAKDYIWRAYEIKAAVSNPKNDDLRKWKMCIDTPWVHPEYLMAEK